MKTLGRNEDNDLYLEGGNLAVLHDIEAQRQIIEAALLTQEGELQFDEDGGIDYFGTVLLNPSFIDFWAGLVKSRIEAFDFVKSINDFQYRFDKAKNTLYWSMVVETNDGGEIVFADRKITIDGKPGIDIKWDNVYDKPDGAIESLEMVEGMQYEAENIGKSLDVSSSTLRETKDLLSRVLFGSIDEEYKRKFSLTFTFSGVPVGAVIDFSNLRLDIANNSDTPGQTHYSPFIVDISDGVHLRSDTTWTIPDTGLDNEVWFKDSTGERTQAHTIVKGGTVTVTIRGNISAIKSADTSKPIFLDLTGDAFGYLTGIEFGENEPLALIGDGSFIGMKNLNSIDWGASSVPEVKIGNYAFSDCASLPDLMWIPNNVVSVGKGCFKGCINLTSLKGFEIVPNKVDTTFVLPEKCFMGCTQLKSANDIYPQTTSIGASAFEGCDSLTTIDGLPDTIVTFGDSAFKGCKNIETILYSPSALDYIGAECFSGCSKLTSVYIPSSLTGIGDSAFSGCTSLNDILSERTTAPEIGENTFDERDEEHKIHVYVQDDNAVSRYEQATGWSECSINKYGTYEFTLSGMTKGETLLGSTSNLISDSIWAIDYGDDEATQRFAKNVSVLPQHSYAKDVNGNVTVTIKGYIRRMAAASIGDYPFLAMESGAAFSRLTGVSITNSPLEMIGDYCFAKCTNLSTISCDFNETTGYCIGPRAFWGCESLKTTDWLGEGLGKLEGNDAFGEGCFYQSGIESLSYATANVKRLPAYCFAETKITSLSGIGGVNLIELGDHCFYGCEELTDISALENTDISKLPDYCFAKCTGLTSLGVYSLLDIVSEIYIDSNTGEEVDDRSGAHVFEGCTALKDISALVNAPSITDLPDYMFAGCTSLEEIANVIIPDDESTAEDESEEISVVSWIKSLGEYCFSGCTGLTDISGLKDSGKSADEDHLPLLTRIPKYCFSGCTGLKTLVGCWNIELIEEGAFSNCTGLLSITGLGKSIVGIGDLAFQNCTGLLYVATVATTVPTLSETAFKGVSTTGLTLYVQDGLVASYSNATGWSSFNKVDTRTVKITFDNLSEITSADLGCVIVVSKIGDTDISGMWYVDFGDGNGFYDFYAGDENGDRITGIDSVQYDTAGSKTVIFFGDISEIKSGDKVYEPPEETGTEPAPSFDGAKHLLGDCAALATSVAVNSSYLKKIGDYCFYDYGESAVGGNTSNLSVSLSMSRNAEIGACAFAKSYTAYIDGIGPIGEIPVCTASIIGAYAFFRSGLTSLSAFTSVTTAGEGAFAANRDLQSLVGLENLISVPKWMFYFCSALTSTEGISSATKIGESAFEGCTSLTTVKGLSSQLTEIGVKAFDGCDNITKVFVSCEEPPDLEEDGFSDTVFGNAIVYVPAGKEQSYKGKPYWNKFLQGETRPDAIRTRSLTFVLEGVNINDKIVSGNGIVSATGAWTISYGEGEESRTFEAGETTLPSYTFKTTGTKVVKMSGPITAIRCSENAYPVLAQRKGINTWLKRVEGSDALEIAEIGDYTFRGCSSLESVTEMPTVTTVGSHAFENSIALSNVSGLSGVDTISEYAFSGCASLKNLYGLHSVKTIGERAFNGCSNLVAIDGLGMNVTTIGDYAFASCPLEEVQMFAENPPTLFLTAFDGLDLSTVPLYVRTKCISAYSESSTWGQFANVRSRYIDVALSKCPANVKVEGGIGKVVSNTYWAADWDSSSADGVACTSGLETRLPEHLYSLSGNHTVRLEGDITEIGVLGVSEEEEGSDASSAEAEDFSFIVLSVDSEKKDQTDKTYVSKYLTSVVSSEYSKLGTVGDASFLRNTALATVTLPALTAIGNAAFAEDTAIAETGFLQRVTTIGDYAFYGCTGIKNLTSLDSIVSIGNHAFDGLQELESIQVGIRANSEGKVPIEVGTDAFGNITSPVDIYLYVPMDSIEAYKSEDALPWKYFNVASLMIEFTMENVPSGTTFAGLSGEDSVGNARVVVNGSWTVDWGDGSDRETMPDTQTTFNQHTYEYDPTATYPEGVIWYSQTENGTTTWYLKSVTISLNGAFTEIGTQSPNRRPFLAVAGSTSNPYLKSVEASTSLTSLTKIGDNAFQGCTGLVRVNGFTNVTKIGDYAFEGCTSLSDLGDEEKCFLAATEIGNSAFAGCTALSNLRAFPSALKLGIKAFSGCLGLTATTGIGDAYVSTPYYTVYNPDLRLSIGDEIPQEWIIDSKTTYTLEDIDAEVVTEGWKVFRQLEIDSTTSRKITNIVWENNPSLNAQFGSFAFENCYFSSINMESFEAPPTIQTTTFTVDPKATIVYVPAATDFVDPVEMYSNAPGWKAFFNIVAASSLSFTFELGALHGSRRENGENPDNTGTGICGFGNILFTGNNFTVDWGDGSDEQTVEGVQQDTVYSAKFPDHAYAKGFEPTGPVTIRLRGNITGFTGVASGTENKPLFAVCNWIRTYETLAGEEVLTSIVPDTETIDYSKVISATVGNNAQVSLIGQYSFYGCAGLKEFIFKKSTSANAVKLTSIGDGAFSGCTNLEKIENQNGMDSGSSIGNYAFYQCESLQEIGFATGVSTIGESAFQGCNNQKFTTLVYTSVSGTSSRTYGLTSVTSIGANSFKGCSRLGDITLPSTLISVGDSAFEGCTNVKEITWAQGVANSAGFIGNRAFYGCSNSQTTFPVSIPSQVHTIGKSAFFNCGMTQFTWNGTAGTGDYAQYSLASDQLADYEPGIFEKCPRLQTVTIGLPVATIPYRAFCNCTNLVTVTTTNTTTILPYAFFGCEVLSTDSFHSIVTSAIGTIGSYAFARCFMLENITVPTSVTELGEGCFSRSDYAFYIGSNWDVENHTINQNVPKFYELSKFEEWMTKEYGKQRIDVWSEYDDIIQTKSVPQHNGMTVSWGNESGGSWVAPSSASIGAGCFMNCKDSTINWNHFPQISQIPSYGFYNCSNLFLGKNLSELPSTVSYLGRFALARTAMNSLGRVTRDANGIVYDNGVPVFAQPISASMSPALFYGCTELESLGEDIEVTTGGSNSVVYPDGLVRLFSTIPSAFPDACFYGCSSLANVNSLAGDLKAVARLGRYCFANCINLVSGDPTIEGTTSITYAMANIVQIGDGCFKGCSGITSEFYGLPKVAYYPYLSFYGCGITDIIALYSYYEDDGSTSSSESEESSGIPGVQVTLEGNSFGGISGIRSINLPYSSFMVKVVSAGPEINDPFSGLENKGTVILNVPNEVVMDYLDNDYWNDFKIGTSYEGLPLAMEISMDVANVADPAKRTIAGYGRIKVDPDQRLLLAIDWGDGSATPPYDVPAGGVFDLTQANISHTYEQIPNASLTRPVTMKIYGNITSFEGAADSATSSIIANKTVVPLFYTAIRNETSTGSGVPRIAENTWFRSVLFYMPNLTTIGDGSFGYCTQMLAPVIPSTVTTIGKNAFFGCDQIRDLNFLHGGIETLGQYCFAYCDNLTDYSNFVNLSITSIPAGCFAKAKSVPDDRDLDWIPPTVTEIGFAAFQHVCFGHFNLINKSTAITIRNYAFRYNTSLVDFTDGTNANPVVSGIKLKLTGTNAFRDCTGLTTLNGISLDSSITAIPVGTFRECISLSDISALSSNTRIVAVGDGAFYKTNLSSLQNLPTSITTIGSYPATPDTDGKFNSNVGGAFAFCANLTSLHGMPTSVSFLGREAFRGCSALEDIGYAGADAGMPTALETIGPKCFIGCTAIGHIKLNRYDSPDGITGLGDVIRDGAIEDAVFEYVTLNQKQSFYVSTPSGSDSAYKDVWAKNSGTQESPIYLRFNPSKINPTP